MNLKQEQEKEQSLSALQRALIALKDARSKLEKYETQSKEPIAIIGMSCRFPGGVDSPESFWQLLNDGVDAISEVPSNRWNINNYYDPDPDATGKISTRDGGFLSQIDGFDAPFFCISPREVQSLDPQQRLLLEVSWEAIERANIVPDQLFNSLTGVFIGIGSSDYLNQLATSEVPQAYWGTGNAPSAATGRLSYILGLTGPNLAVETACSSSLVSLHLACQSLRQQECNLALAGGVNLLLSPETSIIFSQAKMLSPDGRCKTFDASANGYVRGEGCGVIVLKRLSDAVANGDNVLAVIRGTAINQDGASGGLTVPNGPSQVAVIRKALSNGGVDPASVSYIEAHGTGTSLGDPIEVGAIGTVFGKTHSQEQPLIVGTAKTNIGHLEVAAGIAGLMKVVLQLQHQQIAPSLHFKQPNPYINWSQLPVQVSTQLTPWQTNGKSRIAGVSSFGFSGTNAHVVIEEAPKEGNSLSATVEENGNSTVKEDTLERAVYLLTLSAKTQAALDDLVNSYQNYLKNYPELRIADICYTANTCRSHFNNRLAVVASNQQELVEKLRQHQQGEEVTGIYSIELPNNSTAPKIALLFTGQGSQYVNMGRQLYQQAPVFRKALEQCNEILLGTETFREKSLLEILYPANQEQSNSSLLDQTAYTQPCLFALEYALFKLWQSWGIQPDVVMGHSVGEYVAATVAGVFSLEEGLKLIAARGRLMQQLPAGGEMVSVIASESKVLEIFKAMSLEEKVAIAAINGPESTVISGEAEAVGAIATHLESLSIKTKQLQVSHAFHSRLMEPMLAEFEAVAKQVTYSQPQISLISNVTGQQVGSEITSAEYWVNHVRQPVRFSESMTTLHQEGYELFLEIGPKPILLGMGRQCLPEGVGVWLPSLRPGVEAWQQMLQSLGQLYMKGIKVNWSGFDQDYACHKVAIPTYPFQRESYWIDTDKNQGQKAVNGSSSLIVDLLNQSDIEGLNQELSFSTELTADEQKMLPKLLGILVNRHQDYLEFKGNVVYDYYNSFAEISQEKLSKEKQQENNSLQFLTFGILPESIPGFSWLKMLTNSNQNPTHKTALLEAQQELRRLCFSQVDFSSTKKVLDFGCGYGSDLITLAKNHPHLQLNGYTISSGQAKFAANQVNDYQLQEQIQIFNRDSSKDEFPDNYNLAFGFEVAHHIKDKSLLFSNISRHLQEEGLLVMADFIANSDVDIDHEETSSYFITKQHWVEQLSPNKLQLISAIDISHEVSNYLYDAEFEENLRELYEQNHDDNVKSAFQSYNQLGKLLSKGLASYVLLTAKKQENLPQEQSYQLNREMLAQLSSYSEVAVKQWVYELKWETKKHQQLLSPNKPGNWLIFADQQTQALKTVLAKQNQNCLIVTPGSSYKQLDDQHYQLNPTNAQEFQQLIKELFTTQDTLEGVVHLWNINTSTEELEAAQELGCASVLYLVQALVSNSQSSIVPLWLVTQGTQNVEENEPKLAVQQAPVWGLSRVIALEHPELKCRRVDLDQTRNSLEALEALGKELLNPDDEDQIAIRGGVRYSARLARRTQKSISEQEQQIAFGTEGSYLLTGGLGALGLEVAQWMVKQGARHIVLNGRRTPSETAQETIQQLEQTGAKISVILGDVSKEEDVASILKQIEASQAPLRGVIHAAGFLDDGVLQQMSWERFRKVMAPKLQGAWYLHQLTQKLPLDFFVCFSSIASLLGSPGQGNYAAANAFMDTLADYRRSMGLPGLSINWGAWAQGGMASRLGSQHQSRLRTTGMNLITPEKGLQVLGELLSQPVSQVGVFPINWSQFLGQLPVGHTISFLEAFASRKLQKETTKDENFLEQLALAIESERNQILIGYLQVKVGKLLGFDKSKLPNPELGFFDMGMDSLLTVELRNLLSSNLGCSISAAELFGTSNIQNLAEHLIKEILPEGQEEEEVDLDDSQNTQNLDSAQIETQGKVDHAIAAELQEIKNLLKEGN
ncbi:MULTISPECIES: type I polyketide synthase [Moorena]|uniref:CurL n=1 Tax=Moorena producens 3L TaxID=489825 RepID=F4Y424_9CYAN|nr:MULTISPECIES: type I polyketide synthase [Moorena]AEE88278.1 CurL [Moorena producens 3L]EGJ28343.1 polyketide synthase module [Moorena producens 3L]NEP67168.1 type I polyketide synthase [Moorena sp. SIO3A5]NES40466.1 type I polyketide synthase [Moorena sp. SIO2C4]OLT68023.1 short-chain dehydrogenase [Moorena producens 3L]